MKIKITLFLMLMLSIKLIAQPPSCTNIDEYFRGRHKVNGMTYGFPYTTFDRHQIGGFNLDNEIQKIKDRIRDEKLSIGSIFDAYSKIYTYASGSKPSDDGLLDGAEESNLARWAKYNAFVFLIGLDDNGNHLDSIGGSYTPSNRNQFKDNALNAFDAFTAEIKGDNGKLQSEGKSLIMWLQAYDYLKASYDVLDLRNTSRSWWNNFDSDRNNGYCTPRNKLRKTAKEFYWNCWGIDGVITSRTGWKKNHGLMASGVLGMASVVLNDAGVETSIIGGFFSWLFGQGPFPHPNYSPVKWSEQAHEGMYDNLFVGAHWGLLADDVPMTSYDGKAGYAEGNSYWLGAMQHLLPAWRSMSNFYPEWSDEGWLKRPYIQNLMTWFDTIQLNNALIATYDNTHREASNLQSLAGVNGRNYGSNDGLGTVGELVDYVVQIATHNTPVNDRKTEGVIVLPNSGNAVMKINDDSGSQHYVNMLFETGRAVDHSAYDYNGLWGLIDLHDGTHEDDDFASFMLAADQDWLAIDPPYITWDKGNGASKTNQIYHHNVLQFGKSAGSGFSFFNIHDVGFPSVRDIEPFRGKKQSYKLHYLVKDFSVNIDWAWPPITFTNTTGYIQRQFNMYKTLGTVYYVLNDYMRMPDEYSFVQTSINGNGNVNDTYTSGGSSYATMVDNTATNRTAIWRHPCSKDNARWALFTHYSALSGNTSALSFSQENSTNTNGSTLNEDAGSEITFNQGTLGGHGYGFHTRLNVKQSKSKTIFQTLLFPYKCNKENEIPLVSRLENDTHVVTIVRFPSKVDTTIASWKDLGKMYSSSGVADTITHLHYARWENSINDTFQTLIGKVKTDAVNAFIEYHSLSWSKFGACSPSYINMRHASIDYGKYLAIDNKNYIQSDNKIKAYYFFTGKYKYEGFVQNVGGAADSMVLYLPDVTDDITDMTIIFEKDASIGSVYDATNKLLRIKLPSDSSRFKIQQASPCVNCFFPKTVETIDSTFNFNTGTTESLGHKLDIVQHKGLLNISNASKMELTCNIYFRNRDSIIMQGPCGSEVNINPCEGIDTTFKSGDKTAIIVNSGTALVLDSASYTYIGNNSGIYVRNGGTLVIKDNAFVRIGDELTCGRGEIIAEQGSYVYIQPNAHIEFNKTIGDTVDRHQFYIKLPPSSSANAGVYFAIDSLLKADTIIDTVFTATTICSLDSIMAPAVHNNDWGYANFMSPKPHIYLRNDTLCPGEAMYINLKRFLNDNQFKFKVCRVDSFWVSHPSNGSLPYWQDTCIVDTMSTDTILPDPVCMPPHAAPDEFWYLFKTKSLHRVTMEVRNDCGKIKDTTIFVFVADSPTFSISVPDIACAGVGTVLARSSHDLTGYYEWSVRLLDTSNIPLIYNKNQEQLLFYRYSQYGLIPDSFDFNDFRFLGGRKYLISLCVSNSCGSICKDDTVNIPAGAFIRLERPLAYAQPLNGATAIKLHGYVSLADSFRWEPTTWLDSTNILTPISTPLDSITYTLIVHSGTCIATDTAHIKYNRFANAGYNDTLCFDTNTVSTETLIGFPYDMSLFLGMLYYYDQTQFMHYYNMYNTGNLPDYFRYFTHFMHYWEFENRTSSCPVNLYNMFTNQLQKELFFKKSWYKTYYKKLTLFNDPSLPALDDFNSEINSNSTLKNHLDSLDNWGNIDPCIDGIFMQYNDYVTAHVNEISASWAKVVDNDTTLLNDVQNDNYFIAVDAPTKTSTYILNVIAQSNAEIDEITVYLDTALAPAFVPAMQWDSTVYFNNFTRPLSSTTKFIWNFGDGTTNTTDLEPIHTFHAFDSSYIVCLSAINLCDTFTYCDTVRIDSAHWGGHLFTQINNNGQNTIKSIKDNLISQKLIANSQHPIALSNYPNPFDNNTIIDYEIWQSYSNAELRITNVLGQQIFSQKLNKPIDKILIDGAALKDALYYYSLIIDGSVKQTKIMSVMH